MTLGEHIHTLRKKQGLSQGELGKLVGTSGDIIGRYERNEVKPSIDVVIKIADALNVSLDYLAGKTSTEMDINSLKRLEKISSLPSDKQSELFNVIDAYLRDFQIRQAHAS